MGRGVVEIRLYSTRNVGRRGAESATSRRMGGTLRATRWHECGHELGATTTCDGVRMWLVVSDESTKNMYKY